jgi:hypothetical protein
LTGNQLRPYLPVSTGSRPISAVKVVRALLVLQCESMWEHQGAVVFTFSPFLWVFLAEKLDLFDMIQQFKLNGLHSSSFCTRGAGSLPFGPWDRSLSN